MGISKIPTHKVTRSRPNPAKQWICGYQKSGFECEAGPTDDGVCCLKATGKREGVQTELSTHCAATCGGSATCELAQICERKRETLEELGPCIPRRSSWFARQNFALNLAILIGGILLLLMAIPQREIAFVPGDLSQKHAQILGNKLISERCSLCHPNSHPGNTTSVTQDELCMKCHNSHMPDAAMGNPHDLDSAYLTDLSDKTPLAKVRFASIENALGLHTNTIEKTKCAMCHIEHHGKQSDLKAMSNKSCQTCHKNQFQSFASGHPQFDGYPYRTERRIAFDHAAHQSKYFAQKNQEFSCKLCHLDSGQGANDPIVMRGVGFEDACASCHLESIRASTVNGWAIFQTPCLDPNVIEESGSELANWPKNAVFDNEGEISIVLRLLLAADPSQADALRELATVQDLKDLSQSKRSSTSTTIARGYRDLVQDIAANGQSAVARRLKIVGEATLLRELNRHELQLIQRMTAGLPPDLFRQISEQWFVPQNGLASAISMQASPANLRLVSGESAVQGAKEELLGDENEGEQQEQSFDGGSLLSDEEADDLLAGGIDGSGLSDSELLNEEDSADELLGGSSLETPTEDYQKPNLVMTKLRGSEHVGAGGWYLDPTLLAVRYMPTGHDDALMSAWLEFCEILFSNAENLEERLPWYSNEIARHTLLPGGCNDCHVIGQQAMPNQIWDNWRSISRPRDVKLFTKFDHTPHLTLAALEDCSHCHRVLPNADGKVATLYKESRQKFAVAATDWNKSRDQLHECLNSEFQPMELNQCSACHRQGAANDGCTQCHNYHIGNASYMWSHLDGEYDNLPLQSSQQLDRLIQR